MKKSRILIFCYKESLLVLLIVSVFATVVFTQENNDPLAEFEKRVAEMKEKYIFYNPEDNQISFEEFEEILGLGIYSPKETVVNDKAQMRLVKNKKIGNKISAFSLPKIGEGEFVYSPSSKRILVLNFWYVGCLPCMYEAPALNNTVENFIGSEIDFVAVTYQAQEEETENVVKKYLAKSPFNFLMTFWTKESKELFFTEISYPLTVVVSNGEIVYHSNLVGSMKNLENGRANFLDSALKRELNKVK